MEERGSGRGMRVVRLAIATVVVAAGLHVVGSGEVAHAYDRNNCMQDFRAQVKQFVAEEGVVDIGDDLHLDGRPHGTGVVCWATGGRSVQYMAKLYWDSNAAGCAKAEIDVIRTDGVGVSFQDTIVCSTGGLRSRFIEASYFGNTPNLARVKITLLRRPQGQANFTHVRSFGIVFDR